MAVANVIGLGRLSIEVAKQHAHTSRRSTPFFPPIPNTPTPHHQQPSQKLGPGATADEFSSSFTALLTDQSNLVLRALDLFRRKTGKKEFFKVYLEKRTPVQAGLGGGSSNAATTLFAANQVRLIESLGQPKPDTHTQAFCIVNNKTTTRCWAAPRRTRT